MTTQKCDLEPRGCRRRQQRLQEQMQALDVPWVVLTQNEHVRWLTGAWYTPLFCPAAAMSAAGHVVLVAAERSKLPDDAAVDEVVHYEAQWHSTLRSDQREASTAVLVEALPQEARQGRVGVEFSTFGPTLSRHIGSQHVDIEPTMYALRRRKEPDELNVLRHAIAANQAMYEHARQIVRPGINELDVYNQLHAVAVDHVGEPLTYFGQDFQCNSRGGPPRDRAAEAGELYILDLGIGYRGYYSDTSRTLAVGADPTDKQHRAWEKIVAVFDLVASTVRPGASCHALFDDAQQLLDECLPWTFNHHLGHGVGLRPHETPHLNPQWDDHFEVGDFFTAEPGLYHDELRHGMRLEQNYVVTETGVELLTDFPLEL